MMSKTKKSNTSSEFESISDDQKLDSSDGYIPFAWNPFYPLSRTMLFYPQQLSYICPNPVMGNLSYYSTDRQPLRPVASSIKSADDSVISSLENDSSLTFRSYQRNMLTTYTQSPFCGPVITACGTISVQLQHYIRVDITVDKAIRLINFPGRCVAAINLTGNNSCIIHPAGKILQEGVLANMETENHLAKISKRGVTFTSLDHSLMYLVDASGTKSTVEHFKNLSYDFSLEVFYTNAFCGEEALNDCFFSITNSVHRYNRHGDEIWVIAGVCIQQNLLGDVRVSRDYGRRVIHTSPTFGTMSVSTPFIYVAAGCEPERDFFVQRGEKRLASQIRSFKIRNGSQKAGFDNTGKLALG